MDELLCNNIKIYYNPVFSYNEDIKLESTRRSNIIKFLDLSYDEKYGWFISSTALGLSRGDT